MLLFYPMDNEKYTNEAIWQTAIQSLHLSQARTNAIWSKLSNSSRGELLTAEKAPKGLLRKRKKKQEKKTYKKCFHLYISLQGSDACLFWAIGLQFECASPQFGINDVALRASRWIELKWFVTHLLLWCDKPCATSPLKPILPQPINGNLQWNRRTLHLQGRAQSFVS